MKRELLELLVCPQCKTALEPLRLRGGTDAVSGTLQCERCGQGYPIAAGVPCLLPDPHPFPIDFLPPENILPQPAATLSERRHTSGMALVIKKYGKGAFMRAVRQTAELSPGAGAKHFEVARSGLLNPTIRQRAYRQSRESFVRRVMEPVMKRRFWPDERCAAMVRALHELKPRMLLDIATGPGGLLCGALPTLKHTQAFGLEIHLTGCRTVTAEAEYFGFADRVQMIHGDARLMPFADAAFDCVSGWTAAYHISRYEIAMRESARVLRSGGHFLGTFHTIYPSHCPDVLTRAEEEEFIRCAHLPLDIREVCDVLHAVGFAVARKTKIGNSHLVVARKK